MRAVHFAIAILSTAAAGCFSSETLELAGSDPIQEADGADLFLAEGVITYSHVVTVGALALDIRDPDQYPTWLLPFHANLTVEIVWEGAFTPAIRVTTGHINNGDLRTTGQGGSPLKLAIANGEPGPYGIVIEPLTDPGILIGESFTWRVTGERLPEPTATRAIQPVGTFPQSLVYFSFTPTGPDHEVWIDVGQSDASFMIYPTGAMMLRSMEDSVTVRGDGMSPFQVSPRERDVGYGRGGFTLSMYEEGWNQSHWLILGAANATGGAELEVRILGSDIRLDAPPVAAGDLRLLMEDDWSGTLDARAGRPTPGAVATVSRSVSFTTTNGTFLFYALGDLVGTRADDITLSNSTGTRHWTGGQVLGWGADLSGERHASSTYFWHLGEPEDWKLSVRASARVADTIADVVFIADVALPVELHRTRE